MALKLESSQTKWREMPRLTSSPGPTEMLDSTDAIGEGPRHGAIASCLPKAMGRVKE